MLLLLNNKCFSFSILLTDFMIFRDFDLNPTCFYDNFSITAGKLLSTVLQIHCRKLHFTFIGNIIVPQLNFLISSIMYCDTDIHVSLYHIILKSSLQRS